MTARVGTRPPGVPATRRWEARVGPISVGEVLAATHSEALEAAKALARAKGHRAHWVRVVPM